MEIKVKEKVNFSELIKYIYDNNISDGTFIPDNCLDMSKHVHVNSNFIEFEDNAYFTKDDTWTIEREVTKDTKLPLTLVGDAVDKYYRVYCDLSIKEIEKRFKDYGHKVSSVWLINDDISHTLIYKDGELVE
nr:hypothetical protein CoNPh38_CDS0351 [Staphylococcus phage S-CoN_Ph38]